MGSTYLTVPIDAVLKRLLKAEAAKRGVTLASFVESLLNDAVAKGEVSK